MAIIGYVSAEVEGKKMSLKVSVEKLKYYFLIGFIYLFFVKNIFENKTNIVGYIDEMIAASAILILMYKKKIKYSLTAWCVIGFLGIGIISSLAYDIQPLNIAVRDLIVCTKMWLAIYWGYEVFNGFDIKKYAKKIYLHLKIVIGIVAIALVADAIFNIWPAGTRYGIRVFFLFGAIGTGMVSEYLMLLMILFIIKPHVKGAWIWQMILLLAMALTMRAKAIGIVLAAIYCSFRVLKKHKRITIPSLIIPTCIIIISALPLIYFYYFGPLVQQSPRAQLTRVGFKVANDFFPLGSGYATFASYFSGVYYSPLYEHYELSNIYGMTAENRMYLSDSCWPIVFGQFGWIGALLFLVAIISLVCIVQKIYKYDLGKYTAGWLFVLACFINSIAEPVFFNSVIVGIALIFGISITFSEKREIIHQT